MMIKVFLWIGFVSAVVLLVVMPPAPCAQQPPTVVFIAGEKAFHVPTQEGVRVVFRWWKLGGNKCDKIAFGEYTIRFSDGAEIKANWAELQKQI